MTLAVSIFLIGLAGVAVRDTLVERGFINPPIPRDQQARYGMLQLIKHQHTRVLHEFNRTTLFSERAVELLRNFSKQVPSMIESIEMQLALIHAEEQEVRDHFCKDIVQPN